MALSTPRQRRAMRRTLLAFRLQRKYRWGLVRDDAYARRVSRALIRLDAAFSGSPPYLDRLHARPL